ncbi:O-antigen ligase family protein [bacterium]|nr:O-antigen ligase family protein [bacterium]
MTFKKLFLLFSLLFWLVAGVWLWTDLPTVTRWHLPIPHLIATVWFLISFVSPAAFYYSLIPALALFGNNPGGPHHLYLLEFAAMGLVMRHMLARVLGRVEERRSRLDVWVTLFVFWSWLSVLPQARHLWVELAHTRGAFMFAIFSHYVNAPTYGLECVLKLTLAAGIYAQLRDKPWTSQQIATWLKYNVAMMAVTAVAGLGDYFKIVPLEWWRGVNPDIVQFGFPRLQSLYWHSGWYAQYLEAFVPAVLAGAWFASGRRRIAAWSLLGFLALVMVLTMQRAGWLGFTGGCIVGSACATWMSVRDTRAWGRFAIRLGYVLALLVVVALVLAFTNHFVRSRMLGLVAFHDRTDIWRAAIGMIETKPIAGVGLGNYTQWHIKLYTPDNIVYWLQPNWKSTAHNLYLHIFAERGIVGLIFILGIMAAAARLIVARVSEIRGTALFSATDRMVVVAVAGALVALSIDGLFQYIFYVRTIELIYFIMLGWVAGFDPLPSRAPRRWAMPALILAVFAIYATANYKLLRPWTIPVYGQHYVVGGREVKIELPKADRVAIRLASIDPHNQTDPVKFTLRVGNKVVAEDTYTTQTARTYTIDVAEPNINRTLVVTASHDWSPFEYGIRQIPIRRVGVLYLAPEPVKN